MSGMSRWCFRMEVPHLSEAELHWWKRTLDVVPESLAHLLKAEFKKAEDLSCTLTFSSTVEIPDGLLSLLQSFLRIYRPTQYLLIHFAVMFGSPILTYGGGTVFVCAHWIKWSNLSEWIGENALRLQNYSNPIDPAYKRTSLIPLLK